VRYAISYLRFNSRGRRNLRRSRLSRVSRISTRRRSPIFFWRRTRACRIWTCRAARRPISLLISRHKS